MPERKKQHYVPRFYLKNFSNGLNKKSIGIFNIESEKLIAEGSLKDQAYKDYFYGKDGILEEALGQIENPASIIISDIIKLQRYPAIISAEHLIILTFTIFLYYRTKYAADEENEMAEKLIKTIFSKDIRVKDHLDDLKVEIKNSPQLSLKTAAMLIPLTFDLGYKIIHNQSKVKFTTSDNPVIFYNQFLENRKTVGSNLGLAVKGLQIFLPISPNYAIIYYDKGVYRVGNRKEKIVKISSDSDANQLNFLQFLNSNSNIYFNESLSAQYITDTFKRIKKSRRKSKTFVHEYPGEVQPDGKTRSLIHFQKHDIRINLSVTFMRLIKRAKKYEIGDKLSHVRNEQLTTLYTEFMDAVNHGLYKPHQFRSFFKDRLASRSI
jgi:hypothetical protein